MNFIKPVVKHKVSTVCQNNTVVNYSDAMGKEEMAEVYKTLGRIFAACWEKAEMDSNVWRIVKEGAIQGDSYAFFGTKDVRDMQVLSNMSVILADEQNPNIQEQPFIIIRERIPVKRIKEIARRNGVEPSDIETIRPDEDTDYLINNKDDVEHKGDDGKATSLLYLEKINGIVHVAKCTENCVYQELRPLAGELNGEPARGLTMYPIVNFIWEDCPNSARGQGEVKDLLANQIEVNKTIARISMSVKMAAFPRIAYDKTAIQNPDDLDKVGAAIEMNSGGAQSVSQLISYLNPATMSSDARVFLNDLMTQTRELAGASDTALGQIDDPTRVAASAVIAINDQATRSLNEQVSKVKKLTEDFAKLWPEIWFTYNPNGMTVSQEVDGVTMPLTITKDQIDQITPEIRIDVSQDNPWSKNAEQQAADSLLEKQHITFEEYVELVPDNGPVPKAKLQKVLKKREATQQQMAWEASQEIPPEGGDLNELS
ncbi:hypothetical protein LI177_02910 [bacterium 210820-DFI.6.37]|nr:hypothetical protein [bacterium 210820-DFI.6.37]